MNKVNSFSPIEEQTILKLFCDDEGQQASEQTECFGSPISKLNDFALDPNNSSSSQHIQNTSKQQFQTSTKSNTTLVSSTETSDKNITSFNIELMHTLQERATEAEMMNKEGISKQQQDRQQQYIPHFKNNFQEKLKFQNIQETQKPRLQHLSAPEIEYGEILKTEQKLEKLDVIEKRILSFLDHEGIFLQHASEFLMEKHQCAFKGMAKLSPLKFDLSKSPLRRHRANTMQL